MAEAEVGDDVYGEDPTINRLEAMVAEMLGKEAAVLVTSGTQGNLVSVLSHCGRGDEMILGDSSHIFTSEQGGAAALGGVHPRTLPNEPDGTLDLRRVEASIRADNEHYPVTRLLCLENTHNRCGGRALRADYVDAAGALAQRHGLRLHVDGARLWNAAVALNLAPARLVEPADSVTVCLSKGLAGPVGSVVAGSREFVQRARRNRKILGGSMRQAGIIAAAGIVAITEMVERLADDHANARALAQGLARLEGIAIDADAVETNMVFFELMRDDLSPADLVNGLKARGVLLNASGGRRLRAVTRYQVDAADMAYTVDAFEDVLRQGAPADGEKVFVYQ
jgi:threonine aldolase